MEEEESNGLEYASNGEYKTAPGTSKVVVRELIPLKQDLETLGARGYIISGYIVIFQAVYPARNQWIYAEFFLNVFTTLIRM